MAPKIKKTIPEIKEEKKVKTLEQPTTYEQYREANPDKPLSDRYAFGKDTVSVTTNRGTPDETTKILPRNEYNAVVGGTGKGVTTQAVTQTQEAIKESRIRMKMNQYRQEMGLPVSNVEVQSQASQASQPSQTQTQIPSLSGIQEQANIQAEKGSFMSQAGGILDKREGTNAITGSLGAGVEAVRLNIQGAISLWGQGKSAFLQGDTKAVQDNKQLFSRTITAIDNEIALVKQGDPQATQRALELLKITAQAQAELGRSAKAKGMENLRYYLDAGKLLEGDVATNQVFLESKYQELSNAIQQAQMSPALQAQEQDNILRMRAEKELFGNG